MDKNWTKWKNLSLFLIDFWSWFGKLLFYGFRKNVWETKAKLQASCQEGDTVLEPWTAQKRGCGEVYLNMAASGSNEQDFKDITCMI